MPGRGLAGPRRQSCRGGGSGGLVCAMGYPASLVIQGEPYDLQELLPSEGYPAIPYARRTDMGGLRLLARVALIECPRCGRPVVQHVDRDAKVYRCGNAECPSWRLRLVNEAGRSPMLAMVWEA